MKESLGVLPRLSICMPRTVAVGREHPSPLHVYRMFYAWESSYFAVIWKVSMVMNDSRRQSTEFWNLVPGPVLIAPNYRV